MKIKGIDRTANTAWSPQNQYPIYLAVGTAAQQLDASFNTTAALELYSLNLNDPGYDLGLKTSVQSEHRFHKLAWGPHGQASGVIVGGCDAGVIQIYNGLKLLNGENSLVSQLTKHKGSVKALDFNSFQNNLLASGASESEIYIWDLNNPVTPMTPGSKCQPLEDITSVAWNKQVQHILASAFQTKCVIWDLRKNDPIIKLTDNTIRIKWQAVAWNPDIATQLCLGSEDDQNSVIQLWDLRFATSPLKVYDHHQKGVLSISWCAQDTDMLLSCGRDNKIICWDTGNNVPGSDINCEFLLPNQWNFDVSWCPKNPALFACSSFDGHVSIYSLLGSPQQVQTSNKIADSFPGMELYTQAPLQQIHTASIELKKPPKWLKKPVGAKFGFGGKIVTFENAKTNNPEIPIVRQVHVSQVVTETDLVSKSINLESALQNGQYKEFCYNKVLESSSNHRKLLWQFLAANFEPSPRSEFLNLLGFRSEELAHKLSLLADGNSPSEANDIAQLTNQMSDLGNNATSESGLDSFNETISSQNYSLDNNIGSKKSFGNLDLKSSLTDFKINVGDDVDGLLCQSLLMGNIEAAVDLCVKNDRMADAIILAMTGGSELLAKTQFIYFQKNPGYISSLISAVVTEDWSHIIKNCNIESWKEALAAAITHANDQEFSVLCEMLGERLENDKNENLAKNAELCYLCAGNVSKVVTSWLKRNKITTPNNLQEVIELIMILKKSAELRGGQVEISGRLANLFTNYAGILISQGNTEAALSYLGESNDELITELRDRLNGSLGRCHKYMQQPSKRQISSQPKTQRTRAVSAGFYPPQMTQEDVVTTPPISQHNFNLNPLQSNPTSVASSFASSPYVPGLPMPPAGPPMPVPQQTVPPPGRAYSTPSPGPGSLTSRSKHVLDPSVQSATSHSSYYSQSQYPAPVYTPQPVLPNPSFSSSIPGYPTDAFNPPPANPTPPPPANICKPPSVPQPPGWNDPPVVDSSRSFSRWSLTDISAEHAGTRKWKSVMLKSNKPKSDFIPPNPITQPLLGGPIGDTTMNGQYSDPYQNYHQQPAQPPYPGSLPSQYQPGQQLPYPQFPSGNMPQPQVQNVGVVQKPVMPEPMKKPVPEEHAILKNVFDNLKNKCTMAANNPQSKRKLEEVSKKLDILYDGLAENRLSASTLQGLHLIAQHIQAGEYTNGLMLHTQLVSGPDFSQIAGFMPGIKILLQSALQLQVYL